MDIETLYYPIAEALESAADDIEFARGANQFLVTTDMATLFSALVSHFSQLMPTAQAEFFHHIVECTLRDRSIPENTETQPAPGR